MKKETLKRHYFKSKEQLDKLRDNITLKRWKILSEAYKIGKEIWGSKFTKAKLSDDMEMPVTTVLRCLALDKANKKSWDLVNEGKISVFKLAMICYTKSQTYQDEIVNLVIEDNLSTYQITELKIKNLKDINKERHRIACEQGYSREFTAYSGFCRWLDRGRLFLLMKKEHLPDNKISELEKRLLELNKNIERYIKK